MIIAFNPGPSKRELELIQQWRKKLTKDGYGSEKVFRLSRKYALSDLRKENALKKCTRSCLMPKGSGT
jgi:hypothetical protein